MKTLNIGYAHPDYNAKRNIIGRGQDCKYILRRPFNSLLMRAFRRQYNVGGLMRPLRFCYFGGLRWEPKTKIDLNHFWNFLSVWPSKTPCITTFEHKLPRCFDVQGEKPPEYLIKALTSERCRRLIAISQCAKRHQIKFNADHGISEVDEKISVLLPQQSVLCTEDDIVRKAPRNGEIHFMFMGSEFWRKGGGETVRALLEIRKHYPIRLLIIGRCDRMDYGFESDSDNVEEMQRLLADNSDWIECRQRVPNDEVLRLMREWCHVGLLPTREETFGYSVLEMQASGVPVITPDIWALPEMNNDGCGWMVPIKAQDDYGRIDIWSREARSDFTKVMQTGIIEACNKMLSDPDSITRKGIAALKRVKAEHDPVAHSRKLRQIYEMALR